MIIRGILDRSLSNQICVRGFARIKELARVSKADPKYQRELVDKQKQVISNFLTEETYLFFPEVILSLKLKYDFTKLNAKKTSPLTLIEANKPFNSNEDNISVRVIQKKNNKVFDIGGRDEIRIAEIELDDAILAEQIKNKKHPFHRIDGNHRLSAAEQIKGERINTMDVPFCIVLFEETTSEEFDPKLNTLVKKTNTDYEKFERVVFYNINSKSLPLTLEQNLKGILGEPDYFKEDEIKKVFRYDGKDVGINARKLGLRINADDFEPLKQILEKNRWSISISIFKLYNKFIKEKKEVNLVNKVYQSLQAISSLYHEDELLQKNLSPDILLAFIFYKAFTSKTTFNLFYKWLINNHLFELVHSPDFEISENKADNIIEIFNKINENEIKVFVAMPYFSEPIVASHNEIINSVINEIKTNHGINIKLHKIMTHEGETVNIVEDIFKKIQSCNIFISNITGNNANVTYEMGWARALKIPVIIIKEKAAEEPKSDYKLDFYDTYDKEAHLSLKNIIEKYIKAVLVTKYKFKL
jgi:nucleoside 2-deoxyribosyltransferase